MSECKECGSTDNYNFELNIGLCNPCISRKLERLQAEIEGLKPKPLLFGFLDDFRIYVMPEVPENQIWFATHEQLSKAIDYSIQFIEKGIDQALKETKQ